MIFTDKTRFAMNFAERLYLGKKDKAGYPYIYHCIAVAEQQDTEDGTIVALLHDTIEAGLCDIFTFFTNKYLNSPFVIDAIIAITRGDNEKYFDYINRVKQNQIARKVKIADLKNNLEDRGFYSKSLHKRYKKALDILEDE